MIDKASLGSTRLIMEGSVMGGASVRFCRVLIVMATGLAGCASPVTPTPSASQPASSEPSANASPAADGRVLVTGGLNDNPDLAQAYSSTKLWNPKTGQWTASSELYDPARNLWTSAGDMPVGRYQGAIALLDDGSVLITAGGTTQCVGCMPGPWSNEREPAARFIAGTP